MSITPLLFLLSFAIGCVVSLFLAGPWAFYLYQFVYFMFPQGRWWGEMVPGLPYSFIASSLVLAAVLLRTNLYKHTRLIGLPQAKWMLLLLVVYFLVTFVAINPALHKEASMDLLKMFTVMAFAYILLDTPRKLQLSIWFFLFGCAYIGWEAYSVGRDGQGRVEGIGTIDSPEANGIAAALAPAVPILVYLAWQSTNTLRLLAAFYGVWIVNGIVLINSRGSFVAVIGGAAWIIFFMMFSRNQKGFQRLFGVAIIAIGLSGALYLADDTFWERMSTLQEVEDESASGSHRYRMWLATFDLLEDYPLGTGARGFQTLSPSYVDADLFFQGQTEKAVHSSWFQALGEVGWLGGILYLMMLLACFRATAKAKRVLFEDRDSRSYFFVVAIEGGLIAYLLASTFIDQFRAQILYWMIMYTCCAYNIYVVQGHRSGVVDPERDSSKNHEPEATAILDQRVR